MAVARVAIWMAYTNHSYFQDIEWEWSFLYVPRLITHLLDFYPILSSVLLLLFINFFLYLLSKAGENVGTYISNQAVDFIRRRQNMNHLERLNRNNSMIGGVMFCTWAFCLGAIMTAS